MTVGLSVCPKCGARRGGRNNDDAGCNRHSPMETWQPARSQRRTGAWLLRHKSGACVVSDGGGRVIYGDETSAVIYPTKKAAQEVKRGRPDLKIERSGGYEAAEQTEVSRLMRPE